MAEPHPWAGARPFVGQMNVEPSKLCRNVSKRFCLAFAFAYQECQVWDGSDRYPTAFACQSGWISSFFIVIPGLEEEYTDAGKVGEMGRVEVVEMVQVVRQTWSLRGLLPL